MFFSPGLEQLDPALLAFVKCHVTSSVKWEVLRVLANQDGAWIRAEHLARSSHRQSCELARAVAERAIGKVAGGLRAENPGTALAPLAAPTVVPNESLHDNSFSANGIASGDNAIEQPGRQHR